MSIEDKIKNLRKDYISIRPREGFLLHSWLDLKEALDTKPKVAFSFAPLLGRSFALALLLVFVFGGSFLGLAQASQGALPGEPLYPVKRISEDVISIVAGTRVDKVERRADEVVGLLKREKDSYLLKEALEEYKRVVLESKKEAEKEGKKVELRTRLERQERRFREISERSPSLKDDLEEAIEASREGRNGDGKVQGIKEEEKEDRRGKGEGNGKEEDKKDRSGSNSGHN